MHILFIHGALGTVSQLTTLQPLIRGEHELHFIELAGHGETPLAGSAFTIDAFVRQTIGFLDARSIDRCAIFGYSMGGYVALTLAAEHLDRVTGVATLGTKLAWSPDVAVRETSRLDPGTIRTKVPKFAAALEQRHADAGGWEALLGRTAALMTGLGESGKDFQPVMSKIAAPIRLMVGDRDTVVTVDETVTAARAMPNAQAAVLPGTPHPFEHVRLPLLAALLNDFFANV